MKRILLSAVIMIMASYASANSTLEVTERLPGVYVFTAVTDTPTLGSYATSNLVFTADPGTTFSLLSGGTAETESVVVTLGGNLDAVSYYFDADWAEIPSSGATLSTDQIVLNNLGTRGSGTVYSSVDMIQIVANGAFSYSGGLAFDGSMYAVSGTVSGPDLLAGDANRDGVVSAGDYASVQANFGSTGGPGILGDANGDGVVSAGDYASVQANFGNTLPAMNAVPEPATISVLIIGGIVMIRRSRLSSSNTLGRR